MIADEGGRAGGDDAALRIDHDPRGVDTDGPEHGTEEGGFVFAIAVAGAKDIRCGVGLVAADADLDGDIADLALDEVADGFDAVAKVGFACDEFLRLGGDGGIGFVAVVGESFVPLADVFPVTAELRVGAGGWAVVEDVETGGEAETVGGHGGVFEVDGGEVRELPEGAAFFEVDGSGGAVVFPGGFVGEAWRQSEGEAFFDDGDVLVRNPEDFISYGRSCRSYSMAAMAPVSMAGGTPPRARSSL